MLAGNGEGREVRSEVNFLFLFGEGGDLVEEAIIGQEFIFAWWLHCSPSLCYLILPHTLSVSFSCRQVLYVLEDGKLGGGLIGESGAMNVFFLFQKEGAGGGLELVTPPLDGMILPGVTRDSVLGMVRSWREIEVSERELRMDEVRTCCDLPIHFC